VLEIRKYVFLSHSLDSIYILSILTPFYVIFNERMHCPGVCKDVWIFMHNNMCSLSCRGRPRSACLKHTFVLWSYRNSRHNKSGYANFHRTCEHANRSTTIVDMEGTVNKCIAHMPTRPGPSWCLCFSNVKLLMPSTIRKHYSCCSILFIIYPHPHNLILDHNLTMPR
jgi:hypothetical protein